MLAEEQTALGPLDQAPAPRAPDRLADLATGLVLVWWGGPLVHGTGGRERHVLSVGLLLLALATLRVRPWRVLPTKAYGGLVGLSAAAFLVCAVAPTGQAGANEAASWAFAVHLGALLVAWAQDGARRAVLLLALPLSAAASFASGWLGWWGLQDPSYPYSGTFHWYNQQGVFLAAGSVVAAGLLLANARESRLVAWLVAPLALAGTVLTTSRGSMAVLALGYLTLLVAALLRAGRARALARLGAVVVLGALLAVGLTGPPFFESRVGALSGTAARSSGGQTLATNGGHRLDDWGWAARVFADRPLTGTGFHGLLQASAEVDPAGRGSGTPFAHNGYLQVLADGGVLLAVPFLVVLGLLVVRAWRARRAPDALAVPALAGLLVLLLHSGVDFDWTYPALLASPAILVAAVPGGTGLGGSSRTRTALAVLALAVLVLAVPAAWDGALDRTAQLGAGS